MTPTTHAIIITGLSGSGKSTALNFLEDEGFYAIDNLPFFLLSNLLERIKQNKFSHTRLALVMDCRDKAFPAGSMEIASLIKDHGLDLIFLETDEATLISRFSQHRRSHPLAPASSIREGIKLEKESLEPLKKLATSIIDTSTLSTRDLRQRIHNSITDEQVTGMRINLLSFGFKHKLPTEADIVWDVRFLPNPYYIPELKHHTGLEQAVADYVLNHTASQDFLQKLEELILSVIPQYQEEGKARLTIAMGCTGGHHRSVAVTARLGQFLKAKDIKTTIAHRDINR